MKKNVIIGIIIAIIVIAVAIIYFPNTDDSANVKKSFDGEIREFNIVAKQWEFEPAVIEVNKGDKVVLNIESIDVAHGISISDFKINKKLNSGEIITIGFIADKAGEFDFSCNVFCGSGHGNMNGKLIVN